MTVCAAACSAWLDQGEHFKREGGKLIISGHGDPMSDWSNIALSPELRQVRS